MPPALTISEALKDESCWHFAGTHSEQGWTCAWVARRRGWGDDLILQRPSQPAVVVAAQTRSIVDVDVRSAIEFRYPGEADCTTFTPFADTLHRGPRGPARVARSP